MNSGSKNGHARPLALLAAQGAGGGSEPPATSRAPGGDRAPRRAPGDRQPPRAPLIADTLRRVLVIASVSAMLLAIVDLALGTVREPSIALFALSAACGVAHWMSGRGAHRAAGLLFLAASLGVAGYIAVISDGIADSAMLALPLLVVAGTMIFGRRATPAVLIATLAVVAVTLILSGPPIPGDEPRPIRIGSICILLAATAAFMAVATRDVERHLETARRSEEEMQRTYELTLEGWAKMLEYRDEETEGHSRRVAELSVALAMELGLDEQTISHVHRGALLHDIGKVGVPDQILRKPGPLEPQEMAIMRQHPVFARRMLEGITFLEPALCIPYSHHERWDGTGYPDGLKGEEIPLLARLFAVVDHWEALTSDRPYRRAWPYDDALRYIRSNAGQAFDPRVVDAFLRVLDRRRGKPLRLA